MSQPTPLHVLSGSLIVIATVGALACVDAGRSPIAPTVALTTASDPSHLTASSNGSTAVLGPTSRSSASEGAGTSHGTITEPAAYDGRLCELVFPGTPSQTAETLAIWNVGHAILDLPFDTPRPDLYAILPGTMHQVPGYPAFDHDHIVSHAPGVPGYDGTWDLWGIGPGPNFNPSTYQAPRSVAAMFALIRSGVLAGPAGMAALGFGKDYVIHAPLVCR